ncbi:MAG TPA: DNA repair protein RecO [Bauldia sp.]|nr:DNA repair protein RecO [Bauldia sp.]
MQWTDEGVIIGTRRHGETSLIVELMTAAHGRHLGLVRGGRSRRVQPMLQPGNSVTATWRARLDAHLGHYTVEGTTERAARLIEGAAGLYGIQALAALLRLLPERDSHPKLYDGLVAILDYLDDPLIAGGLIVRFELKLLDDLGFGLDLAECAATGGNDDLAYVSPKTGRAVSRSAGEPYHDRLLPLPAFLLEAPSQSQPDAEAVAAAFHLTGYFLARHVYEPRGLEPSEARRAFLGLVARQRDAAA